MSSLARLAVQTAIEAAGKSAPDFLVFCSQHGDLTRLREMLRDIASGVELSPTTFSQSVHNASAGLYTIISRSSAPVSSLASGGSTFAAGWLEAEGFLLERPDATVLLVAYDETLPPEYRPYSSQAQSQYALGLLLRAAGRQGFGLQSVPADQAATLPMAPLFMAWALSTDDSFAITTEGQGWLWRRAR
jgi:Beta-ketoacyl synthase, N-terminal domain